MGMKAEPTGKRSARRPTKPRRGPRAADVSADALEVQREALLHRLENLATVARNAPGFRSAARLLNQRFRISKLTARVAVLEAAAFLITVLELKFPLG